MWIDGKRLHIFLLTFNTASKGLTELGEPTDRKLKPQGQALSSPCWFSRPVCVQYAVHPTDCCTSDRWFSLREKDTEFRPLFRCSRNIVFFPTMVRPFCMCVAPWQDSCVLVVGQLVFCKHSFPSFLGLKPRCCLRKVTLLAGCCYLTDFGLYSGAFKALLL